MGAVADGLVISFATAADEEWLVRNDGNPYTSPRLVGEKIPGKGYVAGR